MQKLYRKVTFYFYLRDDCKTYYLFIKNYSVDMHSHCTTPFKLLNICECVYVALFGFCCRVDIFYSSNMQFIVEQPDWA